MKSLDVPAEERRRDQASRLLRVNRQTPIHIAAGPVSSKVKRIMSIKPQTSYAMPKPENAAGPRNTAISRENYDGAELRPYDGRPGAMDAYSLPSKGFRT